MDDLTGRIVLITGIMASGKSSVAEALSLKLPRSVHLRGDVFRRMITSGRADMSPEASTEALKQLALRYELAISSAIRYAEAGFTVVYQDVVLGEYFSHQVSALREGDYVFVLCPSPSVVAAREAAREKTGYNGFTPADLDQVLRSETPQLGCWLDTSDETLEETVASLLAHLPDAQI